MRPTVGIIGNHYLVDGQYPVHACGRMNVAAIAEVAECLPLVVPPDARFSPIGDLLEQCSGFMFTGGRPNVHPKEYGEEPTEAHGAFDRARDGLTLPLIRALVDRGQPFLAICRGFQELNVAMGGTLHPEIRELSGRMNHRMPPDGSLEEKFALRHRVNFTKGGMFHRMIGEAEVQTNTLHGQGIAIPGARIVVDGRADDGTEEAVHVADAPGLAIAVQWHPEFNASVDPVSRRLFGTLGDATREWARSQKGRNAC